MAILKMVIGAGARGLIEYNSRAEATGGGPPLHTNMAGRNPREMAKEYAAFRALRPNLKKAVGHLMISVSQEDESKMTAETWRAAIDIALETHGITDAPFAAWLHRDSGHLHCHIFFSRIRADASVISDAHNFRKNEVAARRIERELGLKPPTPLPPESKPGNRRTLENAARRAERKGERKMDYARIKIAIDDAIKSGASSPETLAEALLAEGYRAGFTRRGAGQDEDGEIQGWRIADAGVTADGAPPTSIKASSIHRDLAWNKIALRLAANRPAPVEPGRARSLADAARIALARIEAGEINIEKLAQHLEAGGVGIEYFHDEEGNGEITGWRFSVAGQRAAASSLDPRLGWGHVQMALRDNQQQAGLAPPPLGGRPQRGHGLAPAERQAGEGTLSRRLRAFGFKPLEAEGPTALWANRRGDQLRVLPDRVELHAAPSGRARWDDRAVSAWVAAAKLTQGDRLSLVNAALDTELRQLLIEACAAEGVTIIELADEIERERERLIAAGAALDQPALGLRAAPADGEKAAAAPPPATEAQPPSQPPATEAAPPSPAAAEASPRGGEALIAEMESLQKASLALPSGAALRERAADLRRRASHLAAQHFLASGGTTDEAGAAARNRAFGAAVSDARRGWDAKAAPGQPKFGDALKALSAAEDEWTAARGAPEPARLADPLGRAAKARQAAIDAAAQRLEAARQRLKALNARIYHDPTERALLDRRALGIYAAQEPRLFESEHLDEIAARVDAAAKQAEQREREAEQRQRLQDQRDAARQRQQDQDQDQAGDQDDDQRQHRPKGG